MKQINIKVIYDQNCADYLNSLGIQVVDGGRINCPYRQNSDSCSFTVNGPVFFDHASQEGGNVWELALKMNNGDKKQALESLHEAAGVPFVHVDKKIELCNKKEIALKALEKVQKTFCIKKDQTPERIIDYLISRNITGKSWNYLSYIPVGFLDNFLTKEEIEYTGLKNHEGKLILWYFNERKPIYYASRQIENKEFRKASLENDILTHPIWNIDSLYRDPHVIWAEGFFDCLSLIELGYSVAGELTCHLTNSHEADLIKALRWRKKNHPDWTFTICLDNDEMSANGRRPGNEAAEKIAVMLLNHGIDVKWVNHNPSDEKEDINDLHRKGLISNIQNMISNAKCVSEYFALDEATCLKNIYQLIALHDFSGAHKLVRLLNNNDDKFSIKEFMERLHEFRWDWRKIYTDDIEDLFLHGSDVHVIYKTNKNMSIGNSHSAFNKSCIIDNIRKFQRNPAMDIRYKDIDIEPLRPVWRVSKEKQRSQYEYNLFRPSPLLLQKVIIDEICSIPEQWKILLDNIAGADEQKWLLNHMATYVQTLEKPRTIPVLVGKQGTGKTSLAKLFGEGIGGFASVDITQLESAFNEYLMNPVVLLDELSNSQQDSNRMKNRLKDLVNSQKTINQKYKETFTVELNNYILIASNEQVSHTPLVIEKDDRRYSIICGGKDQNLRFCDSFNYKKLRDELPEFMRYLLSVKIDEAMAYTPLINDAKKQLQEMGEDIRIAVVRDLMEEQEQNNVKGSSIKVSSVVELLNNIPKVRFRYTCKNTPPILKELGYTIQKVNNQNAVQLLVGCEYNFKKQQTLFDVIENKAA